MTIYIPGPVDAPFQQKFIDATFVLNLCMLDRGYFMVGIPGDSDHPATFNLAYMTAFDACDLSAGLREVVAEHVKWQVQLNSAQKSFINDSIPPVFDCAKDRGWDFGQLQHNPRGLLWIKRLPPVTETQMINGTYLNDMVSCGLYNLQLG